MPTKLLPYIVINELKYNGQGHIINIAKRHTNRRWRQYTPEKQCNIELEMQRLCIIQSIELKGFGTYIVEISFKDEKNVLVTKLKYNFDFFDESINEKIVCEKQIKFVDVKLINNESNPKRMGLNHFFMRGEPIKKDGQQSDSQQIKKKKKKGQGNQIWVRQKVDDDPWGLDNLEDEDGKYKQVESKSENKGKKRGKNKIQSQNKAKAQGLAHISKREQPGIPFIKSQLTSVEDEFQQGYNSKPRKKHSGTINSDEISSTKLQLQRNQAQIKRRKQLYSQKFEQKFKIKYTPPVKIDLKDQHVNNDKFLAKEKQQKYISVQEKEKAKQQLIQKLKFKMGLK